MAVQTVPSYRVSPILPGYREFTGKFAGFWTFGAQFEEFQAEFSLSCSRLLHNSLLFAKQGNASVGSGKEIAETAKEVEVSSEDIVPQGRV